MANTQHKGLDKTEELALLVTIRQKMLFPLCCVSLNTCLCSLFTQLMNVVLGLNLTVFGQVHCLIETQLHNAMRVTETVFTP